MNYRPSFVCVDNSKYRSDFEVGFAIYLRAIGPSSLLDFKAF
jgi:hypothetical protein